MIISPDSRALSASWRSFYARCAIIHRHHHHLHHLRGHNHMGMGTPLGNCQAWGRCPGVVSPSHSYLYRFIQFDPFSSMLIQQIEVLISSSFELCIVISFCKRVRVLSIIKISVESRALLCCYDLKKVERTKEFILILWIVITSHIESMMHKNC